jgi:predicted RNase H-like nuclease (RuvC/YqgF family)
MAKRSTSTLGGTALSEPDDEFRIYDDTRDFATPVASAPLEKVHTHMKAAQEELLQLKMRTEEIERTKQELEMISEKQTRFAAGKRDLLEKMNRSITSIERELYANQKLVEELNASHDAYTRHVEVLKGLLPEKWEDDVIGELDKALGAIEDAEDDFVKSTRRINTLRNDTGIEAEKTHQIAAAPVADATSMMLSEPESLKDLMRKGFGLSLPLVGGLLVLLLLARALF